MSSVPTSEWTNPDIAQNPKLSQWISVEKDGKILLRAGKVELGQGIGIVQLQIAAEELDVPIDAIRMVAGNTDVSVDLGYTSGSNSVQMGGMALRQICAQVRQLFVEAASSFFKTSTQNVILANGLFSAATATETLTYSDLAPHVDLNTTATNFATT